MLTDTAVRAAKPKEKPYKLHDRGGLYVLVRSNGTRCWRYNYRIGGKARTFALGTYPPVTLAEARSAHGEARKLVGQGICPSSTKRRARQHAASNVGNTVKALAEQWYGEFFPHRSGRWREQVKSFLDRHILPAFGNRPVTEITAADILGVVEPIAKKYPQTGIKVQQTITRILGYGVRKLKVKYNVARELEGTVVVPATKHLTALEQRDIPGFLAKLDGYTGRPLTALALRALLLTATRKNELLQAKWSEFDFPAGQWVIPAERMKNRLDHVVPLSKQVLELLERAKALSFGSELLFHNRSNLRSAINAATPNVAFKKLGISADPHGLRSCFSTWANENGFRPDVIERCLAHVELNKVRASYNRAEYLPERRQIMQAWADFVTGATREQSNVTMLEEHRKRA